MESYVEDIKEFGSTIKSDTSAALEAAATNLNQPASPSSDGTGGGAMASISEGFSSFVSGMSELAQDMANELNDARLSSPSPARDPNAITAAELHEKLNSTEEKEFEDWLVSFDMEQRRDEIAELLATNTAVLALHQELVPSELSSEEFWGRYFFKLEKAAKKESDRQLLLSKMASNVSEAELSWNNEFADEEKEVDATVQAGDDREVEQDEAAPSADTQPSSDEVDSAQNENSGSSKFEEETSSKTHEEASQTQIDSSPPPVEPTELSDTKDHIEGASVQKAQPVEMTAAQEEEDDVFGWS